MPRSTNSFALWGWLSRAAAWTNGNAVWIASTVLISFALIGSVKALYKPLWFDEILTALIARLPNTSDLWAISKSGADGQPPGYDYAMRASVYAFGNDALGIRLPSLGGYLIFCACLYSAVARRTSGIYGLFAMMLAITSGCWYYATEGRPYGLVLGCAGLAAWCWQTIAMGKAPKLALPGFGLALFCAFNVHFYSPLLCIPFAVAELVRSYIRRKVALSVWIALLAPCLTLIAYAPVIRGIRVNNGTTSVGFSRPSWFGSLDRAAVNLLGPSLATLIVIALVFSLLVFAASRHSRYDPRGATIDHELVPDLVLALSFTLLPIFGVALSVWVTHIFYPRYVIAFILGFAMLFSLGLGLVFSKRTEPMFVALMILCFLVGHRATADIHDASAERVSPVRERMRARIRAIAIDDQLPIVIAGAFDFITLRYYTDPVFMRRVYYLSSTESAARWLGFTNSERIIQASAPYFGTQVIDYHSFIKRHPNFYVFGGPGWLRVQLLADHANLVLLHELPEQTDALFRVHISGS